MLLEVNIKKETGSFSLNVDFTCDEKYIGLMGASGSGKSMTLKCIAGIMTPDCGRIVLGNQILFDSEKKINLPPQKRKIGYLFQNYALFPNLTVEQNIGITKADRAVIHQLIRKMRLEGLEKRYPSQLSGGQQQRVALARILAYEPNMILLDEPFSAIDAYLREQLQEEMLTILSEYQGKLITVSHNPEEIETYATQMAVLDKGSILQYGAVEEVFSHPATLQTARIIGCRKIAKATRIDDYHINIQEYGLTVTTKRKVTGDVIHVALKAPLDNRKIPVPDGKEITENHLIYIGL